MKIVIQQGRGGWRWARVARNGKQTANNETHPTKANAIRAAKADVVAVIRGYDPQAYLEWRKQEADGVTTLTYRRIG